MDSVPIELAEIPLKLEMVTDTIDKCTTTKIHSETAYQANTLPIIIPKDPLYKDEEEEPDFEKMTELEKLIYTERQRLLPAKKYVPPKIVTRKKFTNIGLTSNEKSKIRMRRRRARETEDERDARKFRQRIGTMKMRLLQKLKNFDNEEYTENLKKQNTERTRERRMKLKLVEQSEEKLRRKSEDNLKIRLARLRRKVFKTPEDVVRCREKRRESFKKCMAKKTAEERLAYNAYYREKAKERYRKNNQERKKFDLIVQGKTTEEIQSVDDKVNFQNMNLKEEV